MDIVGIGVLIFVVLIILMAISVPLRNYYTGRTEIARLNESIDAKQAEKERLLGDIDKYKSDDYAEQEARRRLGVIAQGETAYRILDPGMTPENSLTTDKKTETDDREWYQVLWDSVAEDTTSDNVDTGNRPDADAKDTPAEPGAESEIQHAVEDAIEQQGGQLGGQPAQQ